MTRVSDLTAPERDDLARQIVAAYQAEHGIDLEFRFIRDALDAEADAEVNGTEHWPSLEDIEEGE